MFQLDITKQDITIEGVTYSSIDFKSGKMIDFSDKSDFCKDLYDFLAKWFDDSDTIEVKTSGSTGVPKKMQVEKSRMMQSAVLTCSFLGLKRGNKTLLCMPMQYIAGMMIAVRSLVCSLDLYPITPCGNPLKSIDMTFDFAAMVPLQIFNTLNVPVEKERLRAIKNLIIGGGAIDKDVESQIKDFPNNVYSTYGMTETLSHIALRKLNGIDASENYFLFEDVNISLSKSGTLTIDAPRVSNEILQTNDVVEINDDGSFKILGRIDNVINTGGIKVQIEELENILKPYLGGLKFAISSLPDPKFGEYIVLVTEQHEVDLSILEDIQPGYFVPKIAVCVDEIPLTETSKIDRPTLKNMIKHII